MWIMQIRRIMRIVPFLPVIFPAILLMETMAAGQTIHGRGGITLPPPPDARLRLSRTIISAPRS